MYITISYDTCLRGRTWFSAPRISRHPDLHSQLRAHTCVKYTCMCVCIYDSYCSNSKMTIRRGNVNTRTHKKTREMISSRPLSGVASVSCRPRCFAKIQYILRPSNSSSSLKNLFLSYVFGTSRGTPFLRTLSVFTPLNIKIAHARLHFHRASHASILSFAIFSFRQRTNEIFLRNVNNLTWIVEKANGLPWRISICIR